MQLNESTNNPTPTTNPSAEKLSGQENTTDSNSNKNTSDAYFDAKKGLEVDTKPAASTIAKEKRTENSSDKKSDSHFESMQEHEIGDPAHISPIANLTSENTKSLNKRQSEDAEKIIQSEEIKKSNSNDPKRKHEIGDPEKQKDNPKSNDTTKKPVTEADNMDRIDTIREHEIGDPEKITKEEISADDSLEAEKNQESTKLDDLKK